MKSCGANRDGKERRIQRCSDQARRGTAQGRLRDTVRGLGWFPGGRRLERDEAIWQHRPRQAPTALGGGIKHRARKSWSANGSELGPGLAPGGQNRFLKFLQLEEYCLMWGKWKWSLSRRPKEGFRAGKQLPGFVLAAVGTGDAVLPRLRRTERMLRKMGRNGNPPAMSPVLPQAGWGQGDRPPAEARLPLATQGLPREPLSPSQSLFGAAWEQTLVLHR